MYTVGDYINAYEKTHPDASIDSAVPQDWWDENKDELKVRGWAVWIYDNESRIFGRPMWADELINAVDGH
jgi:hypothetical protein